GNYLFGDFCSGQLWTVRRINENTWQKQKIDAVSHLVLLSSFGEDENGELYLIDIQLGAVYQLIPNK
ncbi:MAG: glucose dehydrogenase, partial [Chloroflexi bacterium]|nr:glucose dehydrogenase [Chloroflexota bacterium]